MRKNRSRFASKNYPNLYRLPESPYWQFRKWSSQKGAGFRFSTKESKNEAKAYKIGLAAYDAWLGRLAPSGRPVLIRDLAKAILFEKEDRADQYESKTGRTDETFRSYKTQVVKHLVPAIGHLRPDQVTPARWESVITERRRRHPDCKLFNLRKCLIMIQNRAKEEGLITEIPKYRNPDPKPEGAKYLKDEAVRLLVRCASRATKLLMLIMWKQGARPWEVIKSYDKTRVVGIGCPSLEIQVAAFDPNSVTRDDAALMAAAPTLLATLKAVLEESVGPGRPYSADSYLPPRIIELIQKVIAQAEGKE